MQMLRQQSANFMEMYVRRFVYLEVKGDNEKRGFNALVGGGKTRIIRRERRSITANFRNGTYLTVRA